MPKGKKKDTKLLPKCSKIWWSGVMRIHSPFTLTPEEVAFDAEPRCVQETQTVLWHSPQERPMPSLLPWGLNRFFSSPCLACFSGYAPPPSFGDDEYFCHRLSPLHYTSSDLENRDWQLVFYCTGASLTSTSKETKWMWFLPLANYSLLCSAVCRCAPPLSRNPQLQWHYPSMFILATSAPPHFLHLLGTSKSCLEKVNTILTARPLFSREWHEQIFHNPGLNYFTNNYTYLW